MLEKPLVNKNYLVAAGIIILSLLSYQLAFRHTLEAWQTHNQLQSKLTQSTDPGYQPGYLERKSANMDKIINQYKADTFEFRSNVIYIIASRAEKENVKLSVLPVQDASYHTDQLIIEKLEFEGDFFSLLTFTNDLNNLHNIGIIHSVRLNSVPNREKKTTSHKTLLEIYLDFPDSHQ